MRIKNIFTIIQKAISIIPFLFILALLILHLIIPDKTFSKTEQRYLAQLPTFRIENILDGSYASKIELYFSEQFPFRDFWIYIRGVEYKFLDQISIIFQRSTEKIS